MVVHTEATAHPGRTDTCCRRVRSRLAWVFAALLPVATVAFAAWTVGPAAGMTVEATVGAGDPCPTICFDDDTYVCPEGEHGNWLSPPPLNGFDGEEHECASAEHSCESKWHMCGPMAPDLDELEVVLRTGDGAVLAPYARTLPDAIRIYSERNIVLVMGCDDAVVASFEVPSERLTLLGAFFSAVGE